MKPSKDAGTDSQVPGRVVPETKPSSVLINNNTKMEMDNSAAYEGHSDVEMSKFFHVLPASSCHEYVVRGHSNNT